MIESHESSFVAHQVHALCLRLRFRYRNARALVSLRYVTFAHLDSDIVHFELVLAVRVSGCRSSRKISPISGTSPLQFSGGLVWQARIASRYASPETRLRLPRLLLLHLSQACRSALSGHSYPTSCSMPLASFDSRELSGCGC